MYILISFILSGCYRPDTCIYVPPGRVAAERKKVLDLSSVLTDPELGFTAFTVLRTDYIRQNGESVPSNETLPASGCVHPGTPETLELLPEEERHEDYIVVYTSFPLSLGENDGGAEYSAPDRIL